MDGLLAVAIVDGYSTVEMLNEYFRNLGTKETDYHEVIDYEHVCYPCSLRG